jgi:hypothetical protein
MRGAQAFCLLACYWLATDLLLAGRSVG